MFEKIIKKRISMKEIPFYEVKINDNFWSSWLEVNSKVSVFNQLEELKRDKHIYNFKVNAGIEKGTHQGEFYYDSDLYKWLEGACNILKINDKKPHFLKLEQEVKYIADLIEKSQLSDGYINTFYTSKFLTKRFSNLLIFHELYCIGHLIEAAIAYKITFKDKKLLKVAENAVKLLLKEFLKKKDAPGHPEIELALFKLAEEVNKPEYSHLAQHFINMRGKIPHFKTYVIQRIIDMQETQKKSEEISAQDKNYSESKEVNEFLSNLSLVDNLILLNHNLNGKMYQLNKPIREVYEPVGHAVRAMYLYSGVADHYKETKDKELLKALELLWLKMVKARMYITGGIGSQKAYEGFEKDFKHKPENSYSETCAAIGNLMWNWRLLKITKKPKYADLMEKLLYNSMLVGQSIDGERYFYFNPLISQGENRRYPWFICPCCPTNVIRTIPTIGKYIYSLSKESIWVHQYIGNETLINLKNNSKIKISIESQFPWLGKGKIIIEIDRPIEFTLFLRIPKWSNFAEIQVNSEEIQNHNQSGEYFEIKRKWYSGDSIIFNFVMKPKFMQNDPRIKATRNKIALTHGPIVYCMEQQDNLEFDIFSAEIPPNQDVKVIFREDLLNGINVIYGKTNLDKKFTAIPYYTLGNRGTDKMILWLNKPKVLI